VERRFYGLIGSETIDGDFDGNLFKVTEDINIDSLMD
jgi:hypothetical protein